MKKMYLFGIVMIGWSVVSWTMDNSVGGSRNDPHDSLCIGSCFSFDRRKCAYACAAALAAFGLWAWSVYGPHQRIVG